MQKKHPFITAFFVAFGAAIITMDFFMVLILDLSISVPFIINSLHLLFFFYFLSGISIYLWAISFNKQRDVSEVGLYIAIGATTCEVTAFVFSLLIKI